MRKRRRRPVAPRKGSRQAVCLCSGGVDSTVVMGMLLADGWDCKPVFVDYGQVCRKAERRAFDAICGYFRLRGIVREAKLWTDRRSSLLGGPEESAFIPHRNLALLLAGDLVAIETRAEAIACGFCLAQAYPDSSRAFVALAQQCLTVSVGSRRTLLAPLLDCDKRGIGTLSAELHIPVGLTYSCHRGDSECGCCAGCLDRTQVLEASHEDRSV